MFIPLTRICFALEVISLLCFVIEIKYEITLKIGDLFYFIWLIQAANVFLNLPFIVYVILNDGADASGYRPPRDLIPLAICGALLILVYIALEHILGTAISTETVNRRKVVIPGKLVSALKLLVMALRIKFYFVIFLILCGEVPGIVYEPIGFAISVLLLVFLLICSFYLKPHGFIIISLATAILCIGVYLIIWIMGFVIASLILALILSCVIFFTLTFSSGIFSLFFMGDIIAVSNLAFLIPLISVPPVATTAVGGAILKDGIYSTVSKTRHRSKSGYIAGIFINIILLFTVSIPLLSVTGDLSGVFRCKPAYIAGLQYLNRYNLIFSDSSVDSVNIWGFDKEYFVDMDIFKNGNRNCLQNTEQYNSYSDDNTFVILHGGVLRVVDAESMSIKTWEACPIKNDNNTVIFYTGTEALVLGKEELFILNNNNRHYTRLYYPWCEKYLNMNSEEQMDLIYEILTKKFNTRKTKDSPLNLAALVKLSAQRGQLVHYDIEKKIVVFASLNEDGSVTFFRQSSPKKREAFATVTPHAKCARVPYMYDSENDCVFCINDSQVFMIYPDGHLSDNLEGFTEGDIIAWNLFHTDAGDHFLLFQKYSKLYTYTYKDKAWIVQKLDNPVENGGTGLLISGNSFCEWYYDDKDLIRKSTYIKDAFVDHKWPVWRQLLCNSYHLLYYFKEPLDDSFVSNQ